MKATQLYGSAVPGRIGAVAVALAVATAALAAPPRPGTPPRTQDQRDRLPADRTIQQSTHGLSEAEAMRIAEAMRRGNVSLSKAIEAAEAHCEGKAVDARCKAIGATRTAPGTPGAAPGTPGTPATGPVVFEVTVLDKSGQLQVVNVDGSNGKVIGMNAFADRRTTDRPGMHAGHSARILKASDFDGRDVVNAANEKIGDIDELAIDVSRNRVAFAVVQITEGRNRLVAVPWSALRHHDDQCRLDLGANRRLTDAPNFDRNNWPDMSSNDFTTRVSNFFGDLFDQGDDRDDGRDTRDRDMRDSRDIRDGRDVRDSRTVDRSTGTYNVVRSSEIIGGDVRSPTDENLGDIEDLVLDPATGRVAYAVVSFGGFLGFGDKLFAVPMSSLNRTADGKWILAISKERLKEAPGFDKSNWPNMADPAFDTRIRDFYGQPGMDQGRPGTPRDPAGTNRPQR